ncbi:MAG: RraA family protein [Gammaproteobacteria bacterium]|nr:RraA family protein [Gammaproteobacteria bacterium]MBI5618273.1 RraA family protein [Gammaproteobacteria bacterium]
MTGTPLPPATLAALAALDTCTVANAVESTGVRLRNEGFIDASVVCQFPELGPLVGYALPLRIRTADPPVRDALKSRTEGVRCDWWDEMVELPAPRVLVVEDVDLQPGLGAFFGEVHANVFKALGCVGLVTNGAVRDLEAVRELRFHCFAAHAAVSHAYAHVVEVGMPVRIGGLHVRAGDLLHGDRHGVLSVPRDIAARLPGLAAGMRREELALIEYCQSPGFSLSGLRELLRADRD